MRGGFIFRNRGPSLNAFYALGFIFRNRGPLRANFERAPAPPSTSFLRTLCALHLGLKRFLLANFETTLPLSSASFTKHCHTRSSMRSMRSQIVLWYACWVHFPHLWVLCVLYAFYALCAIGLIFRNDAAECGPGRQLWTGMRVSVTAYLLQGPPITENKPQRIERIERIVPSVLGMLLN